MLIENLFLNIGAMKAGTTWLYAMMADHPDVHFSEEKEIHYFAQTDTEHSPLGRAQRIEKFRSAIEKYATEDVPQALLTYKLKWYTQYLNEPIDDQWYVNLFRGNAHKKYKADFSNLYAHLDDDGWEHVKRVTNNLKVVYILRHPLQRLWSHLKFHYQYIGENTTLSDKTPSEFMEMARLPFISDNGCYSRVIEVLKRNLYESQYRVLFFEEIHQNPLKLLRELEGFLGISAGEYDVQKLGKPVNVSASVTMPEAFKNVMLPDVEAEIKALQSLGYEPPEAWLSI